MLMDDLKKTNMKMAAVEEKMRELEARAAQAPKHKAELIELRDRNKQLLDEHKITLNNL